MTWRVAKSLIRLRDQINERFPGRGKSADGTIGDAAHRQRQSDHNPNAAGVVTALDVTHDPRRGPDTWVMAEHLRQRRDSRIKYVISNKRIFSATASPWIWRPYTGNPHSHHLHISASAAAQHYDDARDWDLAWPEKPGAFEEPPLVRPVLRLHSRGEAVRDLQQALEITVDGLFGPLTDAAVRAFQLEAQIVVDGIVGPVTWQALDVTGELD